MWNEILGRILIPKRASMPILYENQEEIAEMIDDCRSSQEKQPLFIVFEPKTKERISCFRKDDKFFFDLPCLAPSVEESIALLKTQLADNEFNYMSLDVRHESRRLVIEELGIGRATVEIVEFCFARYLGYRFGKMLEVMMLF